MSASVGEDQDVSLGVKCEAPGEWPAWAESVDGCYRIAS